MLIIDKVKIGKNFAPYIIAELSANHGGSIERAKHTILAAKNAGASTVKMQTYTADTMTIDSNKEDFQIKDGLWKGYNLFKLYKEAYTPFEWHQELFTFAKNNGITIFSTPFDETAVDLLTELNAPAYKIASFELTDLPLIEYVAKQKKPMLMSTGMASLEEVSEAIECCKIQGNDQLLLFHCISSYPAAAEDSNLLNIKALQAEFNIEVGLSDHTTTNLASSLAISLGAVAIEKHFKLDNKDCGPDSSFSILPSEFKILIEDCNTAKSALGSAEFCRSISESANKVFRRSIYFIKDLKAGHTIVSDDIKRIRPGFGLEPKFFNKVVGKTLVSDVERGDAVSWENFL